MNMDRSKIYWHNTKGQCATAQGVKKMGYWPVKPTPKQRLKNTGVLRPLTPVGFKVRMIEAYQESWSLLTNNEFDLH